MSSIVKVHHLKCACIQRLRIHGKQLACHCLLIETAAHGLVLVDTGLGLKDYADIPSRLGFAFAHIYANPKKDPSLAAINQIKALGLDPTDVRHIVMTHMDLDHVGGLADFPNARVHMHRAEFAQCTERKSIRDKHRYPPAMWSHGLNTECYEEDGERWFGFEAVRSLRGLPEEILMIPLHGHTMGHCGVAIDSKSGWLLHAGDAYFDPREVKQPTRECAAMVGAFQAFVQTDKKLRYYNQDRLRSLIAREAALKVFCAHNPFEFEELQFEKHDQHRASSESASLS